MQIDKLFAGLALEARQGCCRRLVVCGYQAGAAAGRCRHHAAGGDAADLLGVCQRRVEIKDAGCSANHGNASEQALWHEHGCVCQPLELAAGLRIEVDIGRVAARAGHDVGSNRLQLAAAVAGHLHALHRALAVDADQHTLQQHRNTGGLRQPVADFCRRAPVNDGRDFNAGAAQGKRYTVGAVAGGGQHNPLAAGHAVMRGVALHRIGEHDTRAIVVREQHGPLEAASGQDNLLGADLPEPFAHRAGCVRACWRFDGRGQIVVVQPEHGAACLNGNAGLCQRAAQAGQMARCRSVAEHGLAQSPATCFHVGFEQQHLAPGARC